MILAGRLVFALLLSLAVGGCSAGSGSVPLGLAEAKMLWGTGAINDYTMTMQQTCFCPPGLLQPLEVEVVDGQLKAVTGVDQPLENAELLDTRRLTVEGLFQFIENARSRNPARLKVEYNGQYGFPVRIDYDGDPMIADDELQYRITDFEPN